MSDFSKQVNKFTQDITSIITLNKITKEVFFNDINALKDKSMGINAFKKKYIELFDGTFSKYKSTKTTSQKDNFLGSYRRNMNPKYYNQVQSQKVIDFNQELRFQTTEKPKIDKKIAKKFKTKTKHISKVETASKIKYKDKLGYVGFARFEVSKLKQVWNLNKVVKNNLFGYQEIQFRLNYDVIDDIGNIITSNIWITIRSNVTKKETLLNRYDKAFERVLEFVALLEQSKLFIKLRKVCTYVFREAN